MAEVDQSNNPYVPPVSTVEVVPVADEAESDELQDDLNRAFYAVTYGTVFLPGLAYCIALFLLVKTYSIALFLLVKTYIRRAEFSPQQHRSFTITAVICLMLSPLALAVLLGAIVFSGNPVR